MGTSTLSESQLPTWRSTVKQGHGTVGRRVPVVLFHDWGFGDPPFPFLAVPPSEREIWMRVRGAEIYAAGAFFAFPVLGPFGCDAQRDGTLHVIQQQTAFYQRHRDLYLRGRYAGSDALASDVPNLTLAAWQLDERPVAAASRHQSQYRTAESCAGWRTLRSVFRSRNCLKRCLLFRPTGKARGRRPADLPAISLK